MAIASTTVWEFRQNATAAMVNGGGFNPASTNFMTDLTATSANTSSPVVSSATYTFVAADVDSWVYIQAGTNWIPGWYQIASVAGGSATLTAGVGTAVFLGVNGNYTTNPTAGCATAASPSAGTFGVDYSQQASPPASFNLTSVTTAAANAILLHANASKSMLGNILQITSGTNFIVGWYEVTAVSTGVSITVDRNCTSAAGSTGVVNVGGALDLNSGTQPDIFLEGSTASTYGFTGGNVAWFKYGGSATATFTLGSGVSVASVLSTQNSPSFIIGYNSIRGDNPTGNTRPVINIGSNSVTLGQFQNVKYISFFTTSPTGPGITAGGSAVFKNTKVVNDAASPEKSAFTLGGDSILINSEIVSSHGKAVNMGSDGGSVIGCYIHDSKYGFYINSRRIRNLFNIIESCDTGVFISGTLASNCILSNNTIYGSESNIVGNYGVNFASGFLLPTFLYNNIIYGFKTGIYQTPSGSTTIFGGNMGFYNSFFNNGLTASGYNLDPTDITGLNPNFQSVGQYTGSTANVSGFLLGQTTANFSAINLGQDYVHILGGTNLNAGLSGGNYLITGLLSTTGIIVNVNMGNNPNSDVSWSITTGHNFSIGPNLFASGTPGQFYGSSTTGYTDIGAAQYFGTGISTTTTITNTVVIGGGGTQRNLPDLRVW